ncbi:MAG: AbrB/MazE/SpoVT family DNA-binding domain-containing protein [bacterium]|nr:AbrB/MazE/SpoVT family DNA-binding domain-containing protein [bacterium]
MNKQQEVKEMPLIKVKQNYQITLPSGLRKHLNITIGDYMEVEVKGDELILKSVKVVPADQAYFYGSKWQKGEAQADKNINQGGIIGPFDNLANGLNALKTAKI